MSYVVSADVAGFCHGKNHSCSVPVAVGGVSAFLATEDSNPERELLLGSRITVRAGHRCKCGRHQHHLSASPHGTLEKNAFGQADSAVSRFACQRRSGQKTRFEILDSNQVVFVYDILGPNARGVGVLAGRLLVQSRRHATGLLVALRWLVSPGPSAPRHLPMILRQLSGASCSVSTERQIESGIGRCGGGRNAPVDADRAFRCTSRNDVTSYHKRCVPVADAISIDTHAGRFAGQVPRPDNGYLDCSSKTKPAISEDESSFCVFERRSRSFARLGHWTTAALDPERVAQCGSIVAQHLLLGDLGAFPKPPGTRPGLGEHLGQLDVVWSAAGLALMDGFVPQEPTAVPLLFEGTFRQLARPKAVRVAHGLLHANNIQLRATYCVSWMRSVRTTRSSTGVSMTSRGVPNTVDLFLIVRSVIEWRRSFDPFAMNARRRLIGWRRARTMSDSPFHATRSSVFIDLSSRSKDSPLSSYAWNSRPYAVAYPPCGPTATLSQPSVAQHRRQSKTMSHNNPRSDRSCSSAAGALIYEGASQ